ncbi:hypothetical protein B0H19DRAFT_1263679 [Mycena capillaripes]|nr:hypothetical protein B0H19DRAFT_1263679 [Mycena capillaripes]
MILPLISFLFAFQAWAGSQQPNLERRYIPGRDQSNSRHQAGRPPAKRPTRHLERVKHRSVIAGFGPHIGTVPVTIGSNSQGLIISALQDAQTNLAAVGIIPGVTSAQVVKNLQQANSTVAQALVSAQAINSDCLAGAGSASAGSVSATPPTFGTFGDPGSAATTRISWCIGHGAHFGTLGAPGSAATALGSPNAVTSGSFVAPAAVRDSDDLYA